MDFLSDDAHHLHVNQDLYALADDRARQAMLAEDESSFAKDIKLHHIGMGFATAPEVEAYASLLQKLGLKVVRKVEGVKPKYFIATSEVEGAPLLEIFVGEGNHLDFTVPSLQHIPPSYNPLIDYKVEGQPNMRFYEPKNTGIASIAFNVR